MVTHARSHACEHRTRMACGLRGRSSSSSICAPAVACHRVATGPERAHNTLVITSVPRCRCGRPRPRTRRRQRRLICMRNWSQHLLHIAASQHQPYSLHTHTHKTHAPNVLLLLLQHAARASACGGSGGGQLWPRTIFWPSASAGCEDYE